MNLWMIFKVALRAIARNKTRSLLTALGIIVGIAAVIAVVSIGQGASTMMVNEINNMGSNLIMVLRCFCFGMRTGLLRIVRQRKKDRQPGDCPGKHRLWSSGVFRFVGSHRRIAVR